MSEAKIWMEKVLIPTYEIGEAEKNPIFLDKRVYQGRYKLKKTYLSNNKKIAESPENRRTAERRN